MSAAPDGKTFYLAQLMWNTGVVIAKDLKLERQKLTVVNMARLGVKNAIAYVVEEPLYQSVTGCSLQRSESSQPRPLRKSLADDAGY